MTHPKLADTDTEPPAKLAVVVPKVVGRNPDEYTGETPENI